MLYIASLSGENAYIVSGPYPLKRGHIVKIVSYLRPEVAEYRIHTTYRIVFPECYRPLTDEEALELL